MTGLQVMKASILCMLALAACDPANDHSKGNSATDVGAVKTVALQRERVTEGSTSATAKNIPENYVKAFMCEFGENPIVAWERYHNTPAGRAARANDLKVLSSFGFDRRGHDGDLESMGGKITAPPGLTIFGLHVRFLELGGIIGDANSMYITTFSKGVTVGQVVKAARLELDQKSYDQYKSRHYSRHISNEPVTELTLDDEGDGNAELVCQVQSTPD